MAGESSVVNVQIEVRDAIAKAPNFGLPLIVGSTGNGQVGVVAYTADSDGLTQAGVDGMDAENAVYATLAAMAAANPGIIDVKVYNRSVAQTQSLVFTPTKLTEGFTYRLTLDGTPLEYVVQAGDDAADICTAFELLTEAVTNVTSSVSTGTIVVGPTAAGTRVSVSGVSKGWTVKDTSADGGIVAELDAALLEDPDFDSVFLDSTSKTEIVLAAAWCASNDRILYAHSIDTEILTSATTDVASALGPTGTANQACIIFHDLDTQSQGYASAVASYLTYHPGTASMHMWSQVAAGEALSLTPAQRGYAISKNVSVITTMAGVKCVINN